MIDVCLGYLVISLNKHHLVAKVFKAGLDRSLDLGELLSIAVHVPF